MADESLVNGVAAEEEDQEEVSEMASSKVALLMMKVEGLEREKAELEKENEEVKEKTRKWEEEALWLKSEKEKMEESVKKAEEDGKALAAIAGRAADLETEVSRLQHDLVSAMSEGDEANAELQKTKKTLEENKLSAGELEKEKELMKARFLSDIEEVKKAKAVVEANVSELESKIKGIREEAKAELAVKECELSTSKKKVAELEAAVADDWSELHKEKGENKALQEALKTSEAKVTELETKLIQLQKKVEEAEKAISELKVNTSEAVNGVVDRDAELYIMRVKGHLKGSVNLQWAVVAGATAFVIGGITCLHYARKR
ncbi:unnamed protein product [Rhodiola kirilowii]